MVKKILSVFAIASMMLATSCSNDEFDSLQNGKESTVTFTAQLPDGLQTKSRAYGNGETAKTLTYAVYEVGENDTWTHLSDLDPREEKSINNLTTTVSLRLVNGNKYAVVFWADAPSSIYTFNATDKKVTADYDGANSNEEAYDAFYAVEEITVNGTSLDRTVYLKRPFAQLNIGTADLTDAANAGHNVTKAGIKVKTYKTLNFDGTVADEEVVTFVPATLPGEDFPVTGSYKYLTMNYLLMPEDKKADNTVTISYDGAAQDRTFQNVPLQRNFRTNIYGNLLTSTGDITVEIKPEFDGSFNSNGGDQYSSVPQVVNGSYEVYNAAQWNWLVRSMQNGTPIKLMNDIDFDNAEIKSIYNAGNLDGNGKTIRNFYIDNSNEYSVGLFEVATSDITIKDLTLENVKVKSFTTEQGFAGALLGDVQNGKTVTVNNVNVINADVCGVQSVGGLVGFINTGSKLIVKNTTVKNSYIHNQESSNESGFVCGLVGKVAGTLEIGEGVELANNKIVGIYASRRGENSIAEVSALHPSGGTITGENNVSKNNNTITKFSLENSVFIATKDAFMQLSSVRNKTIVLTDDIDCSGITVSPIHMYGNCTFDGQGHTLSNVNTALYSGYASSLFQGENHEGKNIVRNLVIRNISNTAGKFAASLFASIQDKLEVEIENVHIYDAALKNAETVGGFVGFIGQNTYNTLSIKNSSINNSTVEGEEEKVGALVGRAYGNTYTCENVVINDVTVNGSTATASTVDGSKGPNHCTEGFEIR